MLGTAQNFADSHGEWIATRLAKVPERVAFDPGASVPLRGTPHRIVHWTNVRGATQATRGAAGEPIIAVSGERPHVAAPRPRVSGGRGAAATSPWR